MIEVLIGVFIALICLGAGFFFGLMFSKNPTIQFKVTKENIVDYKNFPDYAKVSFEEQLEQYKDFEKAQAKAKAMSQSVETDIDSLYNEYFGGDR